MSVLTRFLSGFDITCEVQGCSNDVFAACHSNQYNGNGLLLCFQHFETDACKKASTPETEDGNQQPNNAFTTLLKQKKMISISDDEKEAM